MSAENTCTFDNNKLFKKFKEKLAVTPGSILHAYLHRFMRKWKLLSSTPGCGLYFPPWRASEIPVGRGSKRRQFSSKGVGTDCQGLFFQGLWNKNYCFYCWSYIYNSLIYIAECFFHSLPVWCSLHVSNMNVIGSWIMPVIQLIALYFTI